MVPCVYVAGVGCFWASPFCWCSPYCYGHRFWGNFSGSCYFLLFGAFGRYFLDDLDGGVDMVLGFSRHGLVDWLMQRISAVVIASYFLCIVSYIYVHPHLDYNLWRHLFHGYTFKIFSTFALLSILVHAWIGIWTVLTDYVKPVVLALILQVSLIFALFFYLVWGLVIVWF